MFAPSTGVTFDGQPPCSVLPLSKYAQAIIISLVTASLFGTIHPTQEEGRKVISLSAFASMVGEGGARQMKAQA